MIILEAIREGNSLRIGLSRSGDTIRPYETQTAPMEKIERECRAIFETLNKASEKGIGDTEALGELKDLGRILSDELLTAEIQKELRTAAERQLVLQCDDHLVHIPWELLCVEDSFLCQRFGMGRIVHSGQSFPRIVDRKPREITQMWVVADPEGNLPSASLEGGDICDLIDAANSAERIVDAFFDSGAGTAKKKIRKRIRNFDILHFAGHMGYDPGNLERCGWKFADGVFNARDILSMAGGSALPSLVFSNACQSARTEKWESQKNIANEAFGLANAFMMAGVKHYVGPSWEIRDESGNRFARQFYRGLLAGETVGEALRLARQMTIDQKADTCWASYVLYGDPSARYFRREQPAATAEEAVALPHEPAVARRASENARETGLATRSQAEEQTTNAPEKESRSGKPRKSKKLPALAASVVLLCLVGTAALLAAFRPQAPAEDDWTSRQVNLTVVYDSQSIDRQLEDILAAAVELNLKKLPRVTLLDRMTLPMTLEEMDLGRSEWMDPEQRMETGEGLPAHLRLFIRANHAGGEHRLQMRLIDNRTGEYVDIFSETFDAHASIIAQGDSLANALVERLKDLYPLRGAVSAVSGKDIELNVGANQGVGLGDRFRLAMDDGVVLKVVSVKEEGCAAKLEKGAASVINGDKVESF